MWLAHVLSAASPGFRTGPPSNCRPTEGTRERVIDRRQHSDLKRRIGNQQDSRTGQTRIRRTDPNPFTPAQTTTHPAQRMGAGSPARQIVIPTELPQITTAPIANRQPVSPACSRIRVGAFLDPWDFPGMNTGVGAVSFSNSRAQG